MRHIKSLLISILCLLTIIYSGQLISIDRQADYISQQTFDYTAFKHVEDKEVVGDEIGGEIDKPPEQVVVSIIRTWEEPPEWPIINPLACLIYTQGYWSGHKAIDAKNFEDCSGNRTIYLVDDGQVIQSEYLGGYGLQVIVQHPNGYITTYSHLSTSTVSIGSNVIKGDKLGEMGVTGRTTGMHLHFEIIYDTIKLNPKNYLRQYEDNKSI